MKPDDHGRLPISYVRSSLVALILGTVATAHAQTADTARGAQCPSCAEWNAQQKPFRLYGDTYYVGTHGLSAILVTSAAGHVLIDGGLAESAPLIIDNIEALGFRVEDVRVILNSHAHFDHAGGIAALQRATGARVIASVSSAHVLRAGASGRDDPQFGVALDFPPVPHVDDIADGDSVRVGPLVLTAHLTPGHTPGGTTWTWRSCEGAACVDVVYADSQSPISADGFRFSDHADVVQEFGRGADVLEHLRCDLLVTPHPDASELWRRVAARDGGDAHALLDPGLCARYAEAARRQLTARLQAESPKR